MSEKSNIRKVFLFRRDSIIGKKRRDEEIIQKVKESDQYKNSNNILAYYPVGSEIDITPLLKQIIQTKNLYLPFIETEKIGLVKSLDNLATVLLNNKTFRQPLKSSNNNIDLVLVPGIAFDKNNNRLGVGAGWYDKYLSDKNVYKIGLTYKECLTEKLPRDLHDIAMDKVIFS